MANVSKTRHGLTPIMLDAIHRANEILERYELPIKAAMAENVDTPNSLDEVLDGLKTLLRAEVK